MDIIRKISIGTNYKDSMNYALQQNIYGGHKISDIREEEDKFSIFIEKNGESKHWKDFGKNMAIAVEYDIEY